MSRDIIEMSKDWFDVGFRQLRAHLEKDGGDEALKEVFHLQVLLDMLLLRLLAKASKEGE